MIPWRPSSPKAALSLGVLLVASGTALLGSVALAAGGKVTICHRTHSTTNPYRRISVSVSSVNGSSANDHSHHTGAVFDPAYAYPANAKNWGDVIPDNASGGAGTGLNWQGSPEGQAMYASSRCQGMSAQQFYDTEREAGVPREQIVADLEEQRADEDAGVDFTTMTYTGDDESLPDYAGTPSTSVSPSPSASASVSESASVEPSVEPSASPEVSASPEESASPEPSESVEPSVSVEPSETAAPSASPEPSESVEPSASPEPTMSVAPSESSEPAVSASAEPSEPASSASAEPSIGPSTSQAPVTISPPAPPAPTKQRLGGVVWLDLDADGVRDPGEPGIPAIGVTLTAVGVPSAGRTASTGPAGGFGFDDLPVGTYRVRATVPPSLRGTHDPADVVLPAGAERDASIGLAGTSVFAASAPDGPVVLRWSGADGVPGTPDDVAVDAVAVAGAVTVKGLPAGEYIVVAGGTTTRAMLVAGRTTTAVLSGRASAPAPAARPAALPRTGGPLAEAVPVALTLLAAGAVSLLAARRPGCQRRGAGQARP